MHRDDARKIKISNYVYHRTLSHVPFLFDGFPAIMALKIDGNGEEKINEIIQSSPVANRLEFILILNYNMREMYNHSLEKIGGILQYIDRQYVFEQSHKLSNVH